MCFSWTYAATIGPIWLVGDLSYFQSIQKRLDERAPKSETVQVEFHDPVTSTTSAQEVKTRDIRFGKTEIADPFPYPPPSTFTWNHCAMLHDLVNPKLCEIVAKHWASKEKWSSTRGVHHELHCARAEPHIVFLWVHEERTSSQRGLTIYDFLQRGARSLENVLKTLEHEVSDNVIADQFVALELQLIWKEFCKYRCESHAETRKHICAGCGIKFVDKLRSCKKCGIRYCSEDCQTSSWEKHKLVCGRGRSPLECQNVGGMSIVS